MPAGEFLFPARRSIGFPNWKQLTYDDCARELHTRRISAVRRDSEQFSAARSVKQEAHAVGCYGT